MSEDKNIGVPQEIDKIRAILNIIINSLPNGDEIRAKIEDDQSSAGFLE